MKFQLTTFEEVQSVDVENGVIYGVNIITKGPARGHDLEIDQTTLEQVIQAASEYENGVKVKLDHGSGVTSIVGSVKNFRIQGDKVKGDLHFLKTAEGQKHIMELAKELPDTFGLSVSINGMHETKGGITYARCSRIRSCDIVTDPAANPDGLLSERVKVDTSADSMDSDFGNLKDWCSKAEKRFAGLEAVMDELRKAVEMPDEDEDKEKPSDKEVSEAIKAELSTALASVDAKFEAINETLKKFSTDPDPASGGDASDSSSNSDDEPKNFDEACAKFRAEGKKPTEAVKLAASKYPALRKADLQAKGLQLI